MTSELFFHPEREPVVRTQVLSQDAFLVRVCRASSEVDPRFRPRNEGGVFRFLDVASLLHPSGHGEEPERVFPIVDVNGTIVAVAEVEENFFEKGVFVLQFLSVDPAFQGKGYASRLADQVVQFAQERGGTLYVSSYTQEGEIKLKTALRTAAQRYGVSLREEVDT